VVKWPEREDDHSLLRGAISPLPIRLHVMVFNTAQDVFIAWYLVKHRDNLNFTSHFPATVPIILHVLN
jgi:hypothetical protein